MLKIYDLSHLITEDMPVYPGTEQPVLKTVCTHAEHGYFEKKLTMYSHTGTHLDAPAHGIKGGKTLDMYALEQFYGRALVIDCTGLGEPAVSVQHLSAFEQGLRTVDFVLLRTDWSNCWGRDRYFSGFPVLSEQAARWLMGFELKGVGVDTISVDAADSEDYAVHRVIMEHGVVIIENLTNLAALPDKELMFSCFPLKMDNSDGSPTRAVAFC